jgi:hypothetical protein
MTGTLRFLATGRQLEDLRLSTGISPVAGENHTRNMLSDISRTERAVFKGNAYFVFCFVLNRVNRVGLEGLCHMAYILLFTFDYDVCYVEQKNRSERRVSIY